MNRTEIHISHSQGTRIIIVDCGIGIVANALKPEELARGWPWFSVGGRNVVVNPDYIMYFEPHYEN